MTPTARLPTLVLVLKGTCLFSAVFGLATPIITSDNGEVKSYLYKSCAGNTCYNFGAEIRDFEIPFPDKLKAALAFTCLALVLSLVQTLLHFSSGPLIQGLLTILSIPNAFFFMLAFVLVASETKLGGSNYGVGFAFMIIGWLVSMAHFLMSRKESKKAGGSAPVQKLSVKVPPGKQEGDE